MNPLIIDFISSKPLPNLNLTPKNLDFLLNEHVSIIMLDPKVGNNEEPKNDALMMIEDLVNTHVALTHF